MKDSKLIQTLKTLNVDEMNSFAKFISSPYFNEGRNSIKLFKELRKFYPAFDSNDRNFNAEYFYKKLFPKGKFSRQVIWNLLSRLEKLAMEFLVQTSLKKKEKEYFGLIYDELIERKLFKKAQRIIEEAAKNTSADSFGTEYYHFKWGIKKAHADYWKRRGRQDKAIEAGFSSSEYFILNMLSELSWQVWEQRLNKVMYNAETNSNILKELLKSFDPKKLSDSITPLNSKHGDLIEFYCNKIICGVEKNSDDNFFKMKRYFDANYKRFHPDELHNNIVIIANYCVDRIRHGENKFLKTIFDINNFRLKNQIGIYMNGRMNKLLFHQIVTHAVALKKIKWTEDFIKEYSNKLLPEHKDTMTAIAQSYILYSKKNYSGVLKTLSSVKFIDDRDKLHVRMQTIKALYELNNTEAILYNIDASNHFFINTKAIDDNTKSRYLKFLSWVKRLQKSREAGSKSERKKLKTELTNEVHIRKDHKLWLLSKI